MKNRFLFWGVLILIIACSKEQAPYAIMDMDQNPYEFKSSSSSSTEPVNFRKENDIVRMVTNLAGKDIEIKKIDMIGSKEDPASYFIATFTSSDGEGYSVVPADSRILEPICFIPKGSPADTSSIKPLAVFFQNIHPYLESVEKEMSEDPEAQTKSLPVIRPGDGTLVDHYVEIIRDTVNCRSNAAWGQCPPLGTLIFDDRGYCSVVAVAQTLAYHQKAFGNFIAASDWPNMVNGLDNVLVARLGYELHQDLYFLNGWIAPTAVRVKNFFNDNGFTATNHSSFTPSNVMTYLEDGPVVVLGFYSDGTLDLGTGHYWTTEGGMSTTYNIVDVYEYQMNGETLTYEERKTTHYYQFFYNWGCSGTSNGWYNSGVFKPADYEHNYQYNLFTIHIIG